MTQEKALQVLQSGANVFLTGKPGAGKTYTINKFVEWLWKEKGIRADITAATGIAATHINGMTIHSWSGIGTKDNLTDRDLQDITSDMWKFKRFSSCEVLIIDEISMLDASRVDCLHKLLSLARDTTIGDRPFGGIQIVFVGDFYQLPPVEQHGKAKFAFESEIWNNMNLQYCNITEQHRQEDPVYLEVLTAMREGTLTKKHIAVLDKQNRKLPTNIHITKLYTHNKDVDAENNKRLAEIKNKPYTYKSEDEGHAGFLMALKKQIPDTLILKVGAMVMFTKNKYYKDDEGRNTGDMIYANGTVGTIVAFEDGLPVVEIKNGKTVIASKEEWSYEDRGRVLSRVRQIPLRLAWAITVHKSQGMSLDSAVIYLDNAFEYGQGYVALSRVRSLDGLYLSGFNEKALIMHPTVINKHKEFEHE